MCKVRTDLKNMFFLGKHDSINLYCCISWTGEKLTLDNLDISLEGNKLVIVCGGVGSGKVRQRFLHIILVYVLKNLNSKFELTTRHLSFMH